MAECIRPECSKPAKARGLCSMHLSREVRATKAGASRLDAETVATCIFVAGRDLDGPVKISVSEDPLRHLSGKRLGLFSMRIAAPGNARMLFSLVRGKLEEFGLALGGNFFDVTAEDAAALIDKLARDATIMAVPPGRFYAMAMEAKKSAAVWQRQPFWGCSHPEALHRLADWAEGLHDIIEGTTQHRAAHRQ